MENLCISLYLKMMNAKARMKSYFGSERGGAGIIAAVILIVLVVVLGVAFRGKITELWKQLWKDVDPSGISDPIPS